MSPRFLHCRWSPQQFCEPKYCLLIFGGKIVPIGPCLKYLTLLVIVVGLWGLSVGVVNFALTLPKFRLMIVVHLLGSDVFTNLLTTVRRDRWMSWQDSFHTTVCSGLGLVRTLADALALSRGL